MVNPSKAIPKTLFPSFPARMIFAHQLLLSTSFTQDHPLPRTPPPQLPHTLWSLQAPPVSLTTSSSTPASSSGIFICHENNKDFGIILTLVQGTHSYLHYFFGGGGYCAGVFIAVWASSSCGEQGLLSNCGAWILLLQSMGSNSCCAWA